MSDATVTWKVEIREYPENVLGDVVYGEVLSSKPTPEELEALYLRAKESGWEKRSVVFIVTPEEEQ